MGRLHHAIATKNAEAQKFFDQGLTLVYGFNHDEAIRSFRRAAELDPTSPMPHWGIALALGPNINLDVDPEREKAAYDAAQRAKALAAQRAGRRARLRRRAGQALLERPEGRPEGARGRLQGRDEALSAAVSRRSRRRDAVRREPDGSASVAALDARRHADRRDRRDRPRARVGAQARSDAHRREPLLHPRRRGVATPDRALPSARRLETLVPAAGHLVHMPAHIYMRTGNYDGASRANAKAADVDRAVHRRPRAPAASTR